MNHAAIACLRCRASLPPTAVNTTAPVVCPACGVMTLTAVFPALFRPQAAPSAGEPLATEEEASCFYHPRKKAATACELCGRFLCALCDVDFNGRHLCPGCIERGAKKEERPTLDNHRTLYDGVALALADLPVFLCLFATFITAPMAIYVAVRYWNAPGSLVRRAQKPRFVLAILLSVAQLVVWAAIVARSLH
ncbi:MAG: hypothetical protein N2689_04450 [Verrucomicrobiae bacterium]|nr:hypothetical protein [Verrucomicrobiae bacterium]